MGAARQTGFTIIETMLFLGISGLLLAGLLIGVNANINQERYKDSVNSFVSKVQQQYTLVTNVQNDRTNKWTCGPALSNDAGALNFRGTTDCTIIGRLVKVTDSQNATLSNIVAYKIDESALQSATSDIDALNNAMSLTTMSESSAGVSSDDDSFSVDWGATIKTLNPNGSTAGIGNSFTMAIVRSPVSGRVMTFVINEDTNDWKAKIITADSYKRPLIACFNPGGPIPMPNNAITIPASNAVASGVGQTSGAAGC